MIYFIQAEEVGSIKIGFTDQDDVFSRLGALQTGSPVKLSVLGTIDGTYEDEQKLHERFAAARITGEWFKPVPQLIQLIRHRLKNQGVECQLSSRPSDRKLLSVASVSGRLGISQEQVLYFINSGRLKAMNVGKGNVRPRWRVEELWLDEFIALRTKQVEPAIQRRKRDLPPGFVEYV